MTQLRNQTINGASRSRSACGLGISGTTVMVGETQRARGRLTLSDTRSMVLPWEEWTPRGNIDEEGDRAQRMVCRPGVDREA